MRLAPQDRPVRLRLRGLQAGGLSAHPGDHGADRGLRGRASITLTAGPIARARNGVIGRDGGLPWRLKTDMANFRAADHGQAGDHGPQDLGQPAEEARCPAAPTSCSPATARSSPRARWSARTSPRPSQIGREQAEEDGAREVCVIGGAALFELALAKAGRIYLTEVDAEVEGDVHHAALRREPLDRGQRARPIPPARATTIPSPSGCWSAAERCSRLADSPAPNVAGRGAGSAAPWTSNSSPKA